MRLLYAAGFFGFFMDDRQGCNSYAVSGSSTSRAAVLPAAYLWPAAPALHWDLADIEHDMWALSAQFACRWLQGLDINENPEYIRRVLNEGVGSIIHAKVGRARSYERAIAIAREIHDIEPPQHVVDVCMLNKELVREFDQSDRNIDPGHDFGDGGGRKPDGPRPRGPGRDFSR